MSTNRIDQAMDVDPAESGWNGLYRIAGVGALLAVGFMLLDVVLSFTGGDVGVGEMSAVDWFAHFHSNWFVGLRNLGIFNVINPLLVLPLYLALYHLHRKAFPAHAALALSLFLLGTGIYVANNQALAMLTLSHQYEAAATEAQRALLAAAGTVILAQAEDFTPGSFAGLFVSNAGTILMITLMLRGRIFSRWISLAGLVGSSCLMDPAAALRGLAKTGSPSAARASLRRAKAASGR